MNSLVAFVKRLRLRQVFTVFIAGLLMIISTACSGANTYGASPQNPAVQAGGANNPYKGGGDGYTDLNMAPSSEANKTIKEKKGDRAFLGDSQLLVATNHESELLYPGAQTPEGRAYIEDQMPINPENNRTARSGGLIQRQSDIGERVEDRIETVKDAVKEASGFLKDIAGEASARPELQKNPAVGK